MEGGELFASERDVGEILEDVPRLRIPLLMRAALGAEATELLGRDRQARGE